MSDEKKYQHSTATVDGFGHTSLVEYASEVYRVTKEHYSAQGGEGER